MDRHPDEDELMALALGALPGRQDELVRHLTDCPACHLAYDDVSTAIDAVLPASPSVAAPPGFEARVLNRLEFERPSDPDRLGHRIRARRSSTTRRSQPTPTDEHHTPSRSHLAPPGPVRDQRRRHRTPLLLAAAAAAGICLGSVGVAVLHRDATPVHLAPSEHGATLVTSSGRPVGTVEPSRAGDDSVMVMQITGGRPGTHYTCRLLLDDGSTRNVGAWWMPASGQATWIAYAATDTINRIELTTDDGHIWSSANLNH
ncbi:anti-sigma factor [Streptomyces chiangmaiensis]|uniref:Zf-HC2 domain-containing protein n=1 Tax=Streptomyces chiangmaiensis TaxID=766497 RepID=A0ABU7FQN8_9ACTN|nr:hypothetical protein [Streptomyces chiangmaiensis]MED7825444.1 hypothetical protein [Streptomyces chiangmaiensis]